MPIVRRKRLSSKIIDTDTSNSAVARWRAKDDSVALAHFYHCAPASGVFELRFAYRNLTPVSAKVRSGIAVDGGTITESEFFFELKARPSRDVVAEAIETGAGLMTSTTEATVKTTATVERTSGSAIGVGDPPPLVGFLEPVDYRCPCCLSSCR